MIFVTVGTLYPFDRLLKAIDEFAQENNNNDFFAQTGIQGYKPKNFGSVETLKKNEYDKYVHQSEAIISHAGMGTVFAAREAYKPLLVMPRLKQFNENINDHQVKTAQALEQKKILLAAYDTDQLKQKIPQLKSFKPSSSEQSAENLIDKLKEYINSTI